MILNRFDIKQIRSFLFQIAILLLVVCPQMGYAKDLNASTAMPDEDKRSCIQTVDGYAYLSEDATLAQTRSAAFANAKRQSVEMAKTHIKSKTKVTDYVVDYDMIWADSQGMVTVIEQKDYGVEDNNRYHVWIKAEVEYQLKQKQGAETVKLDEKNVPLTVKVWTPKKKYKEGEYIQIYVRGNRDFYAKIVDINADGNIIQLLPNDFRKVNFFKANKTYKIPNDEDQFELKASPPFGKDKIVAYTSEAPLGKTAMHSVGKGLNQYKGSQESFATLTRGISIVSNDKIKNSNATSEFYEAAWILEISK